MKLFPKSAKAIDTYMAVDTVNFKSQEDSIMLMDFIKVVNQ
jgi:hypothetical protein